MTRAIMTLRQAVFAFICLAAVSWIVPAHGGPQPATQPAAQAMATCHDTTVGVSFDRPADWVVVEQPKNGTASVSFGQRSAPQGQVPATLQVFMQDNPGTITKIDVTSPAPPGATASKIFTVDGQPARLTAYAMPSAIPNAEMLTVQAAKGSRLYTVTMVFPKAERTAYLQLADTICNSLKL